MLTRALRAAGQPIPVGLGRRGRRDRDQLVVNEIFVRLVAHARSTGRGHLYRWRHALDLDTAAWLRAHGVHGARAQDYGLWIEDGATLSFVLHLDHDEPSLLARTPPPAPSKILAVYARAASGVPVDAALVVTPTTEREQQFHRELADAPVPLAVATATSERLYGAPSPADAIWSVVTAPAPLLPLIEVARTRSR